MDFADPVKGHALRSAFRIPEPKCVRIILKKFHILKRDHDDPIFHNVFSMTEIAAFNLGLYKGNPPEKRWTFDQPGRVDVFCSIHTTMHCIVLVLENSFFALTDAHGRYAIANVPAGAYRLKAWHERVPAQIHEVVVPESGEVKADFSLTIAGLPEY